MADTDALAQKAQGELITRERQLLRYTAYTREGVDRACKATAI